MSAEKKFLIGIGLVTLILVAVGVFFLGKQGATPQVESATVQSVLEQQARWTKGNPDAPVKIIEFADFECPACATVNPIVQQVVAENQDKVYYSYRNYPLPSHINSKIAAQAAEASGLQSKYWEMTDLLFKKQNDWITSTNPKDLFTSYAQELGLDIEKFKSEMESSIAVVNQDYADGNKIGIQATPTFFINGEKYQGAMQKLQLQEIINKASTSE